MNSLELILEELASKNMISIYHSSDNPNLSGTMANDDFNPGVFGAGKMHGKGFYSVWRKEDLSHYGKHSYKGYVNLNNTKIFILDPEFYKEIYKKEMPKGYVVEQLEKAGLKDVKERIDYEDYKEELEKRNKTPQFSTSFFLERIEQTIVLDDKFDGVAYYGKEDGHCLLMWNYHKVKIVGNYNKKTGKTTISFDNFKKQKNFRNKNEAIYKDKKNKIVVRNGKYEFFHEGKRILTVDRTQKEVGEDSIFLAKNIKKLLTQNYFPISIINKLTLTNGKKIVNFQNILDTYNDRNFKKFNNIEKKVISDFKNHLLIEKADEIIFKNRKSTKKISNSYLSAVQKMTERNLVFKRKLEKVIMSYAYSFRIKLTRLDLVPPCFINKNIGVILSSNETDNDINNPISKDGAINFFNVIGEVREVPDKIYIRLKDVKDLFGDFDRKIKDKRKNVKIVFITSPYEEEIQENIHSYPKNSVLVNPSPSSLAKGVRMIGEPLPPSIFTKEGFKEDNVYLGKAEEINFGNSDKTWVFPKKIKIEYDKNFEKKSLDELKKRNPLCIFEKYTEEID